MGNVTVAWQGIFDYLLYRKQSQTKLSVKGNRLTCEKRPHQQLVHLYLNISKSQLSHDFSSTQMKTEDWVTMVKALLCTLGLLCITQEGQLPGQMAFRLQMTVLGPKLDYILWQETPFFLPIVIFTWWQDSRVSSLLTISKNGKIKLNSVM